MTGNLSNNIKNYTIKKTLLCYINLLDQNAPILLSLLFARSPPVVFIFNYPNFIIPAILILVSFPDSRRTVRLLYVSLIIFIYLIYNYLIQFITGHFGQYRFGKPNINKWWNEFKLWFDQHTCETGCFVGTDGYKYSVGSWWRELRVELRRDSSK